MKEKRVFPPIVSPNRVKIAKSESLSSHITDRRKGERVGTGETSFQSYADCPVSHLIQIYLRKIIRIKLTH